jgi:hypothetical protein
MKKAAICLACGLICVALGYVNLALGVLAAPILYGLSKSLTE